MYKTIFIMSILLTARNISTLADENWKLEKNKDDIKVWTRKPENSNLKEFKGVAIMQTTIEKLLSVFRNIKTYEKWMYKVEPGSVKLVKKNNDNDYIVQIIMSAPLIKSRESITHFTYKAPDEKGVVLINLDAAPDMLPINTDYVRVKRMKAFWKFVPLPNGKIEVTHQASSDPGGNVPEAFVNLLIADAPYSMLSKLKEMVK